MVERSEVELQREYYTSTASTYHGDHVGARDEHSLALSFLLGALGFYEIRSVLDVGAGTGRAIQFLKQQRPELRVLGIEPVDALRSAGYERGVSPRELIGGDATRLPFRDGAFDLVTEFAVLHHVRRPELAVREMLRVGRKGVFISDANNFGQGSPMARAIKQGLHALGLWKLADLLKTRGKGYTISEGDGLAYSYSVFDDLPLIERQCTTHVISIVGSGRNPYRGSSSVAVLGIRK